MNLKLQKSHHTEIKAETVFQTAIYTENSIIGQKYFFRNDFEERS